ncbi:MAG: cytochrome c3 family protein [Desulfuromonadaceae bacterium]
MKCFFVNFSPVRFCLLLVFIGMFCSWDAMGAETTCKECHKDVVEVGLRHRLVHRPFLKKQCGACHVAGQAVTPMVKKKNVVDETIPKKIRWFRDAYPVADRHWVLLARDAAEDMLIFKTRDTFSWGPLQKIELPPVGELPSKANDGKAPVISNVRVQDVRRGISITATIAWDTDEFTSAQVDYGCGKLNSSKSTHQFSREHQLILSGLDRDENYTFQVIATDLFGNQSRSASLTFVTDKTFMIPEERHELSRRVGDEAEVDYELFRQGEDYLIVFEAERPVSLAIGVPAPDPTTAKRSAPDLDDESRSHPVLKSQLQTSLLVCDSCHGGYLKESVSHPVNILPKPGMVIPKEYPLLADGRISCMSCHAYHGGNHEYRLLKADKRTLCIGCHTDY